MQKTTKILKVSFKNDLRRIALNSSNFETLEQQIAELFTIEKGTFSIKYKDDEGDLISLCSNEEFLEAINCSKDNVLRITIVEKNREEGKRCGGRRWRHFQQQKESQEQKQEEKQEKGEEEQQQEGQQQGERRGRCGRWNNGPRFNHGRHHHHHHGHKHHQQLPPFNFIEMIAPLAQQFVGNLGGIMNGEGFESIVEKLLQGEHCKVVQNYVCDSCDTPISGTRYHCSNCEDFDFCSSCFQQKRSTHNSEHKFEEISAFSALKDALSRNDIVIDAFIAPGKANEPEIKRQHHAFCDRCDQTIFGIRWKCFECDDFDLCNSCFLESNGKEDIKKHSKDHSFGKIVQPHHIHSFSELKKQFFENKNVVENVVEKDVSEIEMKKKLIQEKLEEERIKFSQIETKLEQERLQLIQEEQRIVSEQQRKQQEEEEQRRQQQEEEQRRQQQEEEQRRQQEQQVKIEEPKQEEQRPMLKIVYPFEQKLEALESMGFVDRERNIQLLVQHKGELLPVIQDLLN